MSSSTECDDLCAARKQDFVGAVAIDIVERWRGIDDAVAPIRPWKTGEARTVPHERIKIPLTAGRTVRNDDLQIRRAIDTSNGQCPQLEITCSRLKKAEQICDRIHTCLLYTSP